MLQIPPRVGPLVCIIRIFTTYSSCLKIIVILDKIYIKDKKCKIEMIVMK